MSFDDIFALLLFIVFIGLPMLNRLQQRGRSGAPPPGQGRPGAPGRPPGAGGQAGRPAGGGAAAAGEAAARQRQSQSGQAVEGSEATSRPRDDDDPFAELAKRLEEARRRVRDASGGGGASAGTSAPTARTIATPAPPSMAIPDPRASAAPRAPRPQRDPFPKTRAKPASPWQERSVSRASLSDDAPALEVERVRPLASGSERRSREIARMQARDLVALDAQSFRKGIMWHMVLSGPVAYRGRRKPSRPASR